MSVSARGKPPVNIEAIPRKTDATTAATKAETHKTLTATRATSPTVLQALLNPLSDIPAIKSPFYILKIFIIKFIIT
jgi:hypothetical protein